MSDLALRSRRTRGVARWQNRKKKVVSWSFLGAIVESEAHLGRFGDAKLSIFDAP